MRTEDLVFHGTFVFSTTDDGPPAALLAAGCALGAAGYPIPYYGNRGRKKLEKEIKKKEEKKAEDDRKRADMNPNGTYDCRRNLVDEATRIRNSDWKGVDPRHIVLLG